MTLSELGDMVPVDKSTVSRIEGRYTAPDRHFSEVCASAFGNEWFLRFWKDSQTWGASVFPQSLREFAAYEAEAVTLWAFEHSLIPGLLQVEAYALAVLQRHPDTSPEQAAERTAARIGRQADWTGTGRRSSGSSWMSRHCTGKIAPAKVMAEQLGHLVSVARRTNVTVQLISAPGGTRRLVRARSR